MPQHNFKDEIKTFYNIGGEIDWIESALKEKEHNGVMALWRYVNRKVTFLEDVCPTLPKHSKSDRELAKTAHFEDCKNYFQICNVKHLLKSETLEKCDNVEEECQKRNSNEFKRVWKRLLDEFPRKKNCPPNGRQQSRSNNSSRFSQDLFLWSILNILLCLKMTTNSDLYLKE